jgi:hypothetical protein
MKMGSDPVLHSDSGRLAMTNPSDGHRDDRRSLLEDARARLDGWKRWMIGLGIALAGSVASVAPFLKGHSLHAHFDPVGKYLIGLSMFLLFFFVGAAALTYNFWVYWRNVKKDSQAGSSDPA